MAQPTNVRVFRRKGAKVIQRPPGAVYQKSFRMEWELCDAVEERAAELTFRTGLPHTFTDLVREGLRLVLQQPLPPRPVSRRCMPVETASGTRCMECLKLNPTICPRTGLEPGATHAE